MVSGVLFGWMCYKAIASSIVPQLLQVNPYLPCLITTLRLRDHQITHPHTLLGVALGTATNPSSLTTQIIVSARLLPLHIISFAWILLAYYRIYSEDGAIPSKTPVAPGDPFIGRINSRSVAPPHTAEAIKFRIAKAEDINLNDPTTIRLFLSPYNQSPLDDTEKVNILDRTGAGSTPEEPLALVAKLSDSERSALESGRRGGLTNAEPLPDSQYRSSIQ